MIFLTFDDGVEWVFRSPRTCYSLDEETAGVVLASEAATIKYIRENSSIPVPEVFYYRYVIRLLLLTYLTEWNKALLG